MNLLDKINSYQIFLASRSPRRQQLMKEMGLSFQTVNTSVDEIYPPHLQAEEIALFLCKLKASAFTEIKQDRIYITADTIVWDGSRVLPKPANTEDASRILARLSGRTHDVITGICLRTKDKQVSFHALTKVSFRELSKEEISYYVNTCQPFDKAGAYGIQEWIGLVGIKRIEGSYYNVVGLPTEQLYEQLEKIIA